MSSANNGPNDGRSRPPATGRIVSTPPPIPSMPTPVGIPSAKTERTVPASPRKPPPLPPETPARRSTLPVVIGCGFVTLLAIAAAVYFALDSFRTKDQLAEAKRDASKARDDYELAASSLLQQHEDEWARTRSGWATKEKELTDRVTEAERNATRPDRKLRATSIAPIEQSPRPSRSSRACSRD